MKLYVGYRDAFKRITVLQSGIQQKRNGGWGINLCASSRCVFFNTTQEEQDNSTTHLVLVVLLSDGELYDSDRSQNLDVCGERQLPEGLEARGQLSVVTAIASKPVRFV